MIAARRTTITSAAGLIVAAGETSAEGRDDLLVRNTGAVTVFLGGPTVTAAQGYPLQAGEAVGLHLLAGDDLYGITASADVEVATINTRAAI